jgi:hypothetical protein
VWLRLDRDNIVTECYNFAIAVSSQLSANNVEQCRYDALCYAAAQCNPGHTHKAVRGKKVAGQSGSEDEAYIEENVITADWVTVSPVTWFVQ